MIQNSNYRDESIDAPCDYTLNEIDKQTHQCVGNTIEASEELDDLIDEYKINIGKVKLTYYETI